MFLNRFQQRYAPAKDVIARAIIDDEMSLTDAAALFGEIYRLLPDPPGLDFAFDDPPADGPPPTVEERLCQRVIDWVKTGRVDAEIVARLEAEFREWRREGTGRLPDAAGLVTSPAELLKQARRVAGPVQWEATRPTASGGRCRQMSIALPDSF